MPRTVDREMARSWTEELDGVGDLIGRDLSGWLQ